MMEKAKSIILGCLVLASLALSYALWYGSPPYEFSKPIASERIHFSGSRSLPELVTPERVVLRREEGAYFVFMPGQELFQTGVNLFRAILAEPGALEPGEEGGGEEPGLRLDFSYPYPWKVPGTAEPSLKISRFFLSLAGDTAWLQTRDGAYYTLKPQEVRQDLLERFKNVTGLTPHRLAADADLPPGAVLARDVYLPLGDVTLPVQQWERERLDLDRLLNVFFIDMSLVRRIEEKDGAVIYTDGQKGARVYPDGAVEYTSAGSKEEPLSGNPALSLAGEIVALFGGWTGSLYLWTPPGPEPGEQRQTLLFIPYAAGRPVISPEGGISLTVNQRGAQSYFRSLVLPGEASLGSLTAIPAGTALERGVEYALQEWEGEGPLPVEALYPGYFLRDPLAGYQQAAAAWFLAVEGLGLIVINAASGLPLALLRF
jgi:regulatory protein YycH of two-component signal transduction system YycFG